MTIKAKLLLLASTALLALLLVAGIAWRGLQEVTHDANEIHDNHLASIVHLSAMTEGLYGIDIAQKNHIISPTDAAMGEQERIVEEHIGVTRQAMASFEKTLNPGHETALFATFQRIFQHYLDINQQVLELSRNNQDDAAQELSSNASRQTFSQLENLLVDMTRNNMQGAEVSASSLQQDGAITMTALAISGIVLVLMVMALTWWVIRDIVRGLRAIIDVTEQAAAGNLCADTGTLRHDEIGQLQASSQQMLASLRSAIADAVALADAVSGSATQISNGSLELSQRTVEQAASLQQTAASMEQMTATVKLNADHARQANQLTGETRQRAENGGEVVHRAVGAMEDIRSSSRRVAEIVGVIDEIAFQTNLLALNAAVEAARAGDQGRGFAVVAGEVRKLAQRSADSAREIRSLIHDSVEKVETGAELVRKSGEVLNGIVDAVREVSGIVTDIAAASQEQASGISLVNSTLTRMDTATQQNAALVEETTTTTVALADQARQLDASMRRFVIDQAA